MVSVTLARDNGVLVVLANNYHADSEHGRMTGMAQYIYVVTEREIPLRGTI